MRKYTRILSSLLAIVMCISCFATSAFAVGSGQDDDQDKEGGYIQIHVNDSDTGDDIEGVVFHIRNETGNIVATVTTDENGEGTSAFLEKGDYTVFMSYIEGGYIPVTSYQTVRVTKDHETHKVEFTTSKETALVVFAYDKTGAPVPNASFRVIDAKTGLEVDSGKTDSSGIVIFQRVGPGEYTVIETVTPDGYELINPHETRVIVPKDGAGYSRFVHIPQSSIKMVTLDLDGNPITGAIYQVIRNNGDFVGNYSADENGEAFTEALDPGTYYVKQYRAADGYLLNTTTRTVTVQKDEVRIETFYSSKISGILIENYVQGSTLGLDGCTFTVETAEGKVVFEGTTDDTGLLTTGELQPGKYTVKQIEVKDGYMPVERVRTVEVTTGAFTTVKFENTLNYAIIIQLTDAEDSNIGLEGAKFLIEAVGGNFYTEVTTDSSGVAKTSSLPDGTYLVHQETAPDGYILPNTYQWATVNTGNDTILHFTNSKISGLVIQCLEEGTHKGIPGAVFEIYEENGKLIDTVTSGTTGIIQINTLPSGTYLIKEISVPGGYTARTATQKTTVTTYDPSTITFYHTMESTLTINLTDSVTGAKLQDGHYRITKDNGDYVGDYTTNQSGQIIIPTLTAGVYIVTQTEAPAGYLLDTTPHRVTIKDSQAAVLDLENVAITGLQIINTCTQDGRPIAGNTFKITTYNGTLMGNYTTNSAGLINVDLTPGEYVVYQTYVANGYVRNEQVWNITVKGGVGTKLEVQNERISGIVIHMVDANTGNGIYGVELEIVDQQNNNVGRFISDNSGNVYLTDVLAAGRYQVRLLNVPGNYTKDTVPKTIVVETGETTELTWALNGIQGQLTIVNYSGEDNAMMNIRKNTKISGAIYVITDASGQVVQTIQGDINGEAHSGPLDLGTYYVQQTIAPSGWQVNATKFAIHVTSKNDNIRVEIYNKAANYSMTVEAHGQATAVAGGQLKYWFNLKNASTSPMNNFYLNITIPTDAVRATTFYTGTFNTAATYYLEYKTNYSDYRTLATGLNSKSQYSYDVSTRGLGLSTGEYVTDIRMVFPTVVAGFHESMAPTLECYVLSTVRNGHEAIMRCEVGGQTGGYYSNNSNGGIWGSTTGQSQYPNNSGGYNVGGSWTTSASQFITYIYGYAQNTVPDNLPKTGY